MKKKLAALDLRVQIALVVVGLLIVAFAGRMLVVSPQSSKAASLQTEIDDTQTQIASRLAAARTASRPQPIKVADLFRLAKAMPDREDMPGIVLTISQIARAAGIHFDTIEPGDVTPATTGSYRARKLHLVFNGDFYALSDFLYRLRNLVTVHDGRLDASGRLFSVQDVTFGLADNTFPQISADLVVQAYIYGTGPTGATPAAPSASTTTTTTTTTTTAPATTTPAPAADAVPSGATAAGAPIP